MKKLFHKTEKMKQNDALGIFISARKRDNPTLYWEKSVYLQVNQVFSFFTIKWEEYEKTERF